MTFFERLQFNPRIFASAAGVGIALGSLFYFLQKQEIPFLTEFKLFVVCAALYALAILFFALFAARDKHVTWEFVSAVGAVCGMTLLAVIPSHGQIYQTIMHPATPLLFIFCVGIGLSSINGSAHEVTLPEKFFIFAQKLLELIAVSAVSFVVISLLGFLISELFSVVGIELPQEFVKWAVLVLLVLVPFSVWSLTYDFSEPMEVQQPVVGLIKFFSVIGYGLTWALAVFLGVYVFVLLPIGFDKVLSTGRTGTTFLALSAVSAVLVYATLLFQSTRRDVIHKISTAVLLSVVNAEVLCLGAVALYAIVKRIDANGITAARYLSVMFALIVIAYSIACLVLVVRSAMANATLARLKSRIETTTLLAVAAAAIFVLLISVVNVELRAAHAHIDRVIASVHGEEFFDARFLSESGTSVISYLAAQYDRATVAQKIQIIQILDAQSGLETRQLWRTIADRETDSRIREVITTRQCYEVVQKYHLVEDKNVGDVCDIPPYWHGKRLQD